MTLPGSRRLTTSKGNPAMPLGGQHKLNSSFQNLKYLLLAIFSFSFVGLASAQASEDEHIAVLTTLEGIGYREQEL